jgi:hypothetical protein
MGIGSAELFSTPELAGGDIESGVALVDSLCVRRYSLGTFLPDSN